MRPINPSNFLSKVVSRMLDYKLEDIIPTLILKNQSSLMKDGSDTENEFFTEEIILDVRIRESLQM